MELLLVLLCHLGLQHKVYKHSFFQKQLAILDKIELQISFLLEQPVYILG